MLHASDAYLFSLLWGTATPTKEISEGTTFACAELFRPEGTRGPQKIREAKLFPQRSLNHTLPLLYPYSTPTLPLLYDAFILFSLPRGCLYLYFTCSTSSRSIWFVVARRIVGVGQQPRPRLRLLAHAACAARLPWPTRCTLLAEGEWGVYSAV